MTQDKADELFDSSLNLYYDDQLPDRAIRGLKNAIRLRPENAEFYSALGQIYYEESRFDQARGCFEKAIELNYRDARALRGLGLVHQETGDDERAIYYYNRSLDLGQDPDAYFNLGVLFHNRGDFEVALEYYQLAAELIPDDPIIYENLGNVLASLGQFSEAVATLQHSLELDPDDSITHWLLGQVERTIGDTKSARINYERAIELDPSNAQARISLAQLLAHLHDHEKAIEHSLIVLDMCEKQNASDGIASAAWELGWSYYCVGQIDKSIEASRRAFDANPALAPVRFNLGLALLAKGRADDARQEYEEGISVLEDINDLKHHAIKDLRDAIKKKKDLPGATEILKTLEEKYNAHQSKLRNSIGAAESSIEDSDNAQ